jgi:glyoxylase-like metal-dependent hydrolase (beta-lactamase superfamily II)
MSDIWLKGIMTGALGANCYLLGCPATREALVIDPGGEGERILDLLAQHDFRLTTVIDTHGHFDHIGGNRVLVERSGAELLLHAADLPLLRGAAQHAAAFGCQPVEPSPEPTRLLNDGDQVEVGRILLKVMHVPGHSPGSVCLLFDQWLFVGDVLFAGSIGRTDLPGGDLDALMRGLRDRLLVLPDATVVYPGHGPETTIGHERRHNPYLRTLKEGV